MKIVVLFFLFTASLLYSQSDITGTLGTGGTFYIKDANNNFLKISQSNGEVNILKGLRLELTGNSSTTGVIFKGTDRFIHDFAPTGTVGDNTFVGVNSGNFTMTAPNGYESSYNTALGFSTLSSNTTGSNNTAVGTYSLYSNTTGYYNTALGHHCLYSNSTGYNNTAVGMIALSDNTTGTHNTALGSATLQLNTTGNDNTGAGYASLNNNTTGYENTASGVGSLYLNTSGNRNTAVGYNSLQVNTTGFQNTAVGHHSLQNNTGNYNTAVGYNAGSTVTSGYNLTLLGIDANPSSATAHDQITLGNAFVTTLRCNTQTITSLSDRRDKKNIRNLELGIDFLMKLKPRIFNWDKREWYANNVSDGSKMQKEPTAGFIAQELDDVQTSENAGWLNLVLKDNPDKLEATPGNLLPVIVKAIQDLKKQNDNLKAKNEELNNRLAKFEQTQNLLASELEKLKTGSSSTKVSLGEK